MPSTSAAAAGWAPATPAEARHKNTALLKDAVIFAGLLAGMWRLSRGEAYAAGLSAAHAAWAFDPRNVAVAVKSPTVVLTSTAAAPAK